MRLFAMFLRLLSPVNLSDVALRLLRWQMNLHEQGILLRQAEFIVSHGRKRSLRHVFLFEELVVFSKTHHSPTGHDNYIYKHSIKVCTAVHLMTDGTNQGLGEGDLQTFWRQDVWATDVWATYF